MTETFSRVKSSLVELLRDTDHRVVALTGRWGTGKTHLWHDVASELYRTTKATAQAIYVSLFGAKTINDLKLRILQNAYLKDASTVKRLMQTGSSLANQMIKRFTGYSVEDAALLWLPQLVTGRLIVIDDIERKHKSLDIDEFLGLLDEYSETHNSRFLILLNTDKLNDDATWSTLHEKVIDAELVLEPSSAESFAVAVQGGEWSYLPEVQAAVAALNINNIRVIRRILRMVNRVAAATKTSGVPASRWIPSTALLTASHYRAVENAPSFEYIKSFNTFERMSRENGEQPDQKELEWDALLERLGITYADEYEDILQEYLQCGLLNADGLKRLFAQYKNDAVHAAAMEQRDNS